MPRLPDARSRRRSDPREEGQLARWVPAPLRPALTSRKTLARVIAGMLASGAAVALMIAFDDVDASAAVTVTCSVSDPTMTVSVSGDPASNVLVITTSGGDYVLTLDGAPACSGQTLSATSAPSISVIESTSSAVPATFEPGTQSGVTFTGAIAAPNTVDLSAVPSGAQSLRPAPQPVRAPSNGRRTRTRLRMWTL
jgi:hypothetical protein